MLVGSSGYYFSLLASVLSNGFVTNQGHWGFCAQTCFSGNNKKVWWREKSPAFNNCSFNLAVILQSMSTGLKGIFRVKSGFSKYMCIYMCLSILTIYIYIWWLKQPFWKTHLISGYILYIYVWTVLWMQGIIL